MCIFRIVLFEAFLYNTQNDKKHLMSATVWISQFWKDENVHWDPKDYDGIEKVHVPAELIWTPDWEAWDSIEPISRTPPSKVKAVLMVNVLITL